MEGLLRSIAMARTRQRSDTAAIEVRKGSTRRYQSLLRRPDGIDVVFDGGSYNKIGPAGEVPHDLAHLIVEDELGLRLGVWGVLVAGGMFRHARVVAGRRSPHATRRGREVIARAGDQIMQAEILTRAVCDLIAIAAKPDVTQVRRAVGERWWTDAVTVEALDRAGRRLHDAADAWSRLAPGDAIRTAWRWPVADV